MRSIPKMIESPIATITRIIPETRPFNAWRPSSKSMRSWLPSRLPHGDDDHVGDSCGQPQRAEGATHFALEILVMHVQGMRLFRRTTRLESAGTARTSHAPDPPLAADLAEIVGRVAGRVGRLPQQRAGSRRQLARGESVRLRHHVQDRLAEAWPA